MSALKAKPTFAALKACAQRAGYSRRVIVEAGESDFYGWIKPLADLDGEFLLIDDEAGERYSFKGWNVNVRDLDD